MKRERPPATPTTSAKPNAPGAARPGPSDYFLVIPVVLAGTINLWKIESLRQAFPIDLTTVGLLSATAVTLIVMMSVKHLGQPIRHIMAFMLCLVPGIALASLNQPYSISKTESLLTIVPLLLLAGAYVLSTAARRTALCQILAVLGLAISLGIELAGTPSSSTPGRIGLEDANVIGLGRMCCLGAVGLLTLRTRRLPRLLVYGAAMVCIHAAILTGSRGPIVGAVAGLLTAFALSMRGKDSTSKPGHAVGRTFLPLALFALALWHYGRSSRLATAFGGEDDASRASLALSSLDIFAHAPWGIGWGDLVSYLPLDVRIDAQGWAQYPHNVLIECAVEGGVLAAAGLLNLWWKSLRQLVLLARTGEVAPLAISIASIVAAMTSSDLTGNRAMWMCLGMGLTGLAARSESRSPDRRRHTQAMRPYSS